VKRRIVRVPPANPFGEEVRRLRAAKGISLQALSDASGVSRSMLSQIERNEVNPTVAVAQRIARAFGVPLGSLVDGPDHAATVEVIRGGDRSALLKGDGCEIRILSPLHLEKDVEFYELRFRPRGALRNPGHLSGTREILTVTRGAIRVTSGKDAVELAPGDSAAYRADVPHALENVGRGPAAAFLVDLYGRA
jgi:transcriptional regulator with XRE-family HTH domain